MSEYTKPEDSFAKKVVLKTLFTALPYKGKSVGPEKSFQPKVVHVQGGNSSFLENDDPIWRTKKATESFQWPMHPAIFLAGD